MGTAVKLANTGYINFSRADRLLLQRVARAYRKFSRDIPGTFKDNRPDLLVERSNRYMDDAVALVAIADRIGPFVGGVRLVPVDDANVPYRGGAPLIGPGVYPPTAEEPGKGTGENWAASGPASTTEGNNSD